MKDASQIGAFNADLEPIAGGVLTACRSGPMSKVLTGSWSS